MIIDLNSTIVDQLSKTELAVVNFINDNEDKLSELSIVDIAFETYSSPSTVSRAIRKCGINGFNELRYKLTTKVENEEIHDLNEIMNKSVIEATSVIEHMSMTNLLSILHTIRDTKKERDRILIFSRGPTALVAQELCVRLQVLDYFAMANDDPEIMRIMSKNLTKREVVIILSLNGETKELIDSAKNAKARGATVISLCCSNSSELFEYSKYKLLGYKHSHIAIRNYEVTSRLPLYIMCRILVDFLVESGEKTRKEMQKQLNKENTKK
ncbi:MurR/RpiR family transcriptional regulator [Anaerostipes faecalis]|uniref:MurR/RpiR family transcriptional regulator n=1 Tax=Anaerostipes faecalis TaxID=2738446 RepID=UPI003F128D8D